MSSSTSTPQKSGVPAVVDPKVCGVCGDKALGNNFNAITCESCKAFFRRNALRTKEYVCPFQNNCKVDAITRRFCQRCRLKKCFDIGMKKEWIMTDEEKKMKKQKIEQNRKKRTSLENLSVEGGSAEGSPAMERHTAEDMNEEITPSAAKKSHVSESQLIQRLTAPILTGVANGNSNDDSLQSGRACVEAVPETKIPKQPMGVHNQNQTSDILIKQNRSRKVDQDVNVIAIQVNTPPPPVATTTSPPTSPVVIFNQHPDSDHIPPQNFTQSYSHHSPNYSYHQQSPWVEGDSSNSSLSPPISSSSHLQHRHQPPPLVKYPPNKRQRLYDNHEEYHHQTQQSPEHIDQTNNNQNPLLASLIQPGHPESSPDHTSSPPVPQIVQSSNCDDNEQHQRPPVLQPQSHDHNHPQSQYHQEYHDDYDRSSPPSQNPYRNGYHHYIIPEPEISSLQEPYHHPNHHASEPPEHFHPPTSYHHPQERMPPLNTIDSILSIAIAAEFNAFGMLGGNTTSKELNKAEQAKLNELLLASQALNAPVDAERPIKETESSEPSLLNIINLTEIAIRRLIKMSKKISGFKNMCQEDQIALLKGGCTEMMILRSAVTYDPDRDSWHIPHSNPGYNINLGVLKEARGNLYEEHQRFNKTFKSEWRKDENIMIILCAITLFTPERHNVIHKDVVKLEQDSYYYLLKR